MDPASEDQRIDLIPQPQGSASVRRPDGDTLNDTTSQNVVNIDGQISQRASESASLPIRQFTGSTGTFPIRQFTDYNYTTYVPKSDGQSSQSTGSARRPEEDDELIFDDGTDQNIEYLLNQISRAERANPTANRTFRRFTSSRGRLPQMSTDVQLTLGGASARRPDGDTLNDTTSQNVVNIGGQISQTASASASASLPIRQVTDSRGRLPQMSTDVQLTLGGASARRPDGDTLNDTTFQNVVNTGGQISQTASASASLPIRQFTGYNYTTYVPKSDGQISQSTGSASARRPEEDDELILDDTTDQNTENTDAAERANAIASRPFRRFTSSRGRLPQMSTDVQLTLGSASARRPDPLNDTTSQNVLNTSGQISQTESASASLPIRQFMGYNYTTYVPKSDGQISQSTGSASARRPEEDDELILHDTTDQNTENTDVAERANAIASRPFRRFTSSRGQLPQMNTDVQLTLGGASARRPDRDTLNDTTYQNVVNTGVQISQTASASASLPIRQVTDSRGRLSQMNTDVQLTLGGASARRPDGDTLNDTTSQNLVNTDGQISQTASASASLPIRQSTDSRGRLPQMSTDVQMTLGGASARRPDGDPLNDTTSQNVVNTGGQISQTASASASLPIRQFTGYNYPTYVPKSDGQISQSTGSASARRPEERDELILDDTTDQNIENTDGQISRAESGNARRSFRRFKSSSGRSSELNSEGVHSSSSLLLRRDLRVNEGSLISNLQPWQDQSSQFRAQLALNPLQRMQDVHGSSSQSVHVRPQTENERRPEGQGRQEVIPPTAFNIGDPVASGNYNYLIAPPPQGQAAILPPEERYFVYEEILTCMLAQRLRGTGKAATLEAAQRIARDTLIATESAQAIMRRRFQEFKYDDLINMRLPVSSREQIESFLGVDEITLNARNNGEGQAPLMIQKIERTLPDDSRVNYIFKAWCLFSAAPPPRITHVDIRTRVNYYYLALRARMVERQLVIDTEEATEIIQASLDYQRKIESLLPNKLILEYAVRINTGKDVDAYLGLDEIFEAEPSSKDHTPGDEASGSGDAAVDSETGPSFEFARDFKALDLQQYTAHVRRRLETTRGRIATNYRHAHEIVGRHKEFLQSQFTMIQKLSTVPLFTQGDPEAYDKFLGIDQIHVRELERIRRGKDQDPHHPEPETNTGPSYRQQLPQEQISTGVPRDIIIPDHERGQERLGAASLHKLMNDEIIAGLYNYLIAKPPEGQPGLPERERYFLYRWFLKSRLVHRLADARLARTPEQALAVANNILATPSARILMEEKFVLFRYDEIIQMWSPAVPEKKVDSFLGVDQILNLAAENVVAAFGDRQAAADELRQPSGIRIKYITKLCCLFAALPPQTSKVHSPPIASRISHYRLGLLRRIVEQNIKNFTAAEKFIDRPDIKAKICRIVTEPSTTPLLSNAVGIKTEEDADAFLGLAELLEGENELSSTEKKEGIFQVPNYILQDKAGGDNEPKMGSGTAQSVENMMRTLSISQPPQNQASIESTPDVAENTEITTAAMTEIAVTTVKPKRNRKKKGGSRTPEAKVGDEGGNQNEAESSGGNDTLKTVSAEEEAAAILLELKGLIANNRPDDMTAVIAEQQPAPNQTPSLPQDKLLVQVPTGRDQKKKKGKKASRISLVEGGGNSGGVQEDILSSLKNLQLGPQRTEVDNNTISDTAANMVGLRPSDPAENRKTVSSDNAGPSSSSSSATGLPPVVSGGNPGEPEADPDPKDPEYTKLIQRGMDSLKDVPYELLLEIAGGDMEKILPSRDRRVGNITTGYPENKILLDTNMFRLQFDTDAYYSYPVKWNPPRVTTKQVLRSFKVKVWKQACEKSSLDWAKFGNYKVGELKLGAWNLGQNIYRPSEIPPRVLANPRTNPLSFQSVIQTKKSQFKQKLDQITLTIDQNMNRVETDMSQLITDGGDHQDSLSWANLSNVLQSIFYQFPVWTRDWVEDSKQLRLFYPDTRHPIDRENWIAGQILEQIVHQPDPAVSPNTLFEFHRGYRASARLFPGGVYVNVWTCFAPFYKPDVTVDKAIETVLNIKFNRKHDGNRLREDEWKCLEDTTRYKEAFAAWPDMEPKDVLSITLPAVKVSPTKDYFLPSWALVIRDRDKHGVKKRGLLSDYAYRLRKQLYDNIGANEYMDFACNWVKYWIRQDKSLSEFKVRITPTPLRVNAGRLNPPDHERFRLFDCSARSRIQITEHSWRRVDAHVNDPVGRTARPNVRSLLVLHFSDTKFDTISRWFTEFRSMNHLPDTYLPDLRENPRTSYIHQCEDPQNVETFTSQLEDCITRFKELTKSRIKSPHAVFLFLGSKDGVSTGIYSEFKFACDVKFGVKSQVVVLGSFPVNVNPSPAGHGDNDDGRNVVNLYPRMFNLFLKFNKKMGGLNLSYSDNNYWNSRNYGAMIFGADVTHSSPSQEIHHSIASIVASIDIPPTTYAARVRIQPKDQEIIQETEVMVRELVQLFFLRNPGTNLHTVFFFRDGVGSGQICDLLSTEIPALRRGLRAGGANADVKLVYLIAVKRHHTRFRQVRTAHDQKEISGEIQPGMAVNDLPMNPLQSSFYLCTHLHPPPGCTVKRGVCRPTLYHLLVDQRDQHLSHLQGLIYNLSYTYDKGPKTLSIVPAIHYAHMACTRGRLYYKQMDLGRTLKLTAVKWGDPYLDNPNTRFPIHPDIKDTMYYL
ncbi:hypothetical protein R1flu_005871 [Riccia fluitans]|uniref:Piwi domain-containing protein n=1 Tax=Riccia fluitans TaxID=41844 RepID=A0ABD1YXE7_9MARC